MWKLALRNVLRHKARSAMTLFAIITGVVGLILSGGFVHDIYVQLGEVLIHSQSGHLQIARKGYFEHGARSPEKYLIENPDDLTRKVAVIPGVQRVMGRLYFSGLMNNGRSDMPIVGEGVNPTQEAELGTGIVMVKGRRLAASDANGMMLGEGLAHALRLNPGDWANVLVNTPDGAINTLEFQIVGVFQTFSKDYDARAVLIPLQAAHDLLATDGVNTLVVELKNTEETNAVATTLAHEFAGHDIEVKTWIQLNDFYDKAVRMYDAQYDVLRLIILLMVLLSVVNTVNMSVFERVGEFGTMMALGNRRRRVFQLIVLENAIIAVVGAVLGLVVGIGLALLISAIGIPMPPPPNADLPYVAHIRIVGSVLLSACLVGLLATILASVIPAARVYRTPPVDALRENV